MAWLGDVGINEFLNDARISDIELHLLLLVDLASVTCIDLKPLSDMSELTK